VSTNAKCLATVAIVLFVSGILSARAHAMVVNLNSRSNFENNPVKLTLGAGAYDVTPIGIADGGAYNAWNAWGFTAGCNQLGANCAVGWLHWYYISSPEFTEMSLWDGIIYSTDLLALSHAAPTSFNLTSPTQVSFYIRDGVNGSLSGDNLGGISLSVGPEIARVPEPSTLFLLALGVAGLGGMAWRRCRV